MKKEQLEGVMKCFLVTFANRVMETREKGFSCEVNGDEKGNAIITLNMIQLSRETLKEIEIECLEETLERMDRDEKE